MSRSIRKETSTLAFGMVGRFEGSSAGFVVTALNAASAASREVVVLRVLSAVISVLALGISVGRIIKAGACWKVYLRKWRGTARAWGGGLASYLAVLGR